MNHPEYSGSFMSHHLTYYALCCHLCLDAHSSVKTFSMLIMHISKLLIPFSFIFCPLTVTAEPIVFDSPGSTLLFPAQEVSKTSPLHIVPSKTSSLVKTHLNNAQKYTFDKEEVIIRKPSMVEVLSDLDMEGQDQQGVERVFHLKKGEKFESSGDYGVNINMADGSDCLVRIHEVVIYPGGPNACLWLSPPRTDKMRLTHIGSDEEEWYRLVDDSGAVIGWQLRDWELGPD